VHVLRRFDDFQEGFENLAGKPLHLALIVLITVIINVLWVSIIFFSFRSVRFPVPLGVLAVGFAVGQIVGILSMIPGGIGTLEGSSSLAYAALGVTFETALSAMAVYRLAYNLIPFAVCLPFYFSLKHEME
jgi:phosphatidylglycerol lysyltransferase